MKKYDKLSILWEHFSLRQRDPYVRYYARIAPQTLRKRHFLLRLTLEIYQIYAIVQTTDPLDET